MTLAFDLVALKRLRNPRAVVVDARRWARHVGIVGENTDDVRAFATRHVIRRDFPQGARDRATDLRVARSRFETDRYVFVGIEDGRTLTAANGWEFLHVESAAKKAGWALEADTSTARTLRTRLRTLF